MDAVLAALQSIGLSAGVFSFTPMSRLPNGNPGLIKRAVALNIDPSLVDDWLSHQNLLHGEEALEKNADVALSHLFDPIRQRMVARVLPEHFILEEVLEKRHIAQNALGVRWIHSLINAGIRESYSTPIYTGYGEYWSLSAMNYYDRPAQGELSYADKGELYWLAANLVDFCIKKLKWRDFSKDLNNKPLAPRELECLFWASKGKSSRETAEILCLKTGTVQQYLKRATSGLGANNKTHAVCIAHQLGYISLSME